VSPNLDRDLAAWERGELPRESLVARHGASAAEIVAVHDRIVGAVASTPIPGVEAGWAALVHQLEPHGGTVVPLRRAGRRGRVIALTAAAALLLAGSAFAAVGPRVLRDRDHQVIQPAPDDGGMTDPGHSGPRHGIAPANAGDLDPTHEPPRHHDGHSGSSSHHDSTSRDPATGPSNDPGTGGGDGDNDSQGGSRFFSGSGVHLEGPVR
jgi:hypothetical protein